MASMRGSLWRQDEVVAGLLSYRCFFFLEALSGYQWNIILSEGRKQAVDLRQLMLRPHSGAPICEGPSHKYSLDALRRVAAAPRVISGRLSARRRSELERLVETGTARTTQFACRLAPVSDLGATPTLLARAGPPSRPQFAGALCSTVRTGRPS
jgi:hypothetical protein